jgi:hypothetical protein
MFLQIFQFTPTWVWGLLAALVALGLSQALPRQVKLRRMSVLTGVLLALSLAGVASSFGSRDLPLLAWAAGVVLALVVGQCRLVPRGTRLTATPGVLSVPGSWLPLALFLGLFAIKYGVGVVLARQPGLASDVLIGCAAGLAYGLFAGLFLARTVGFWRVTQGSAAVAA